VVQQGRGCWKVVQQERGCGKVVQGCWKVVRQEVAPGDNAAGSGQKFKKFSRWKTQTRKGLQQEMCVQQAGRDEVQPEGSTSGRRCKNVATWRKCSIKRRKHLVYPEKV
jgi:hypothetical protein